jgi:hypothetical protein
MSVDPYGERTVPVVPATPAPVAAVTPVTPVAGAPIVHERVVVQESVGAVQTDRRTVAHRRFSIAPVLAVVVAVALGVVGAVAIARAGLDGPLDDPVVQVAGFGHTAVLGFVELGMALVLLWAGLSRDRTALLFVSILFGAASLVAAIEPSVGGGALGIESSWAALLTAAFAIIALAAAVAPTMWRSTERVATIR